MDYSKYDLELSDDKSFWLPKDEMTFKNLLDATNEFCTIMTKTKYLNDGSFGSVSLCNIEKLGTKFVIKTLKNVAEVDGISGELKVLSEVNSAYIPKLFYAGFDSDTYYSFVTEYVSGGSLKDNCKRITSDAVGFIAKELACGIQCLHDHQLSHGDVKPDNIVLTHDGHVKLIDFGSSRDISKLIILPRATPQYQAPEVNAGKPAGAAADWWSYGCVSVFLFQGVEPFVIEKKTGNIAADNFISKLLVEDPSERLKDILMHEFLQTIDPHPKFIPGHLQKPSTPIPSNDEGEDIPNIYGLTHFIRKAILKQKLCRFPSAEKFESFK